MITARYTPLLLDCFAQPKHAGQLTDDNTRRSVQGVVANGDVLCLTAHIEGETIVDIKFLASGSVAIIAGGEWICRELIG